MRMKQEQESLGGTGAQWRHLGLINFGQNLCGSEPSEGIKPMPGERRSGMQGSPVLMGMKLLSLPWFGLERFLMIIH